MTRQAIVEYHDPPEEGASVTITYVDEAGDEWIHGYEDFDDGAILGELADWLTRKPAIARRDAAPCLTCGHYTHPDGEMERAQGSGSCPCPCHPWNRPAHLATCERVTHPNGLHPCDCGAEDRP